MATMTIPRPGGEMALYVAVPEVGGPWPGVVVIHDGLGMTSDLRNQADWLARAGYLAVAPDLYSRGGRLRCLVRVMRAAAAGQGPAFSDLEAARNWLTDHQDCTGRIGVIGFCLGGGFALLLAATGAYRASSVNYGTVPDDAMTRLADACPIVASYGAKDRSLRNAPQQLQRALAAHGIQHDLKAYPDAGHSFLNNHARGEMPFWALVMTKLVNGGYHQPSAVDARQRIIAFFDAHLRS